MYITNNERVNDDIYKLTMAFSMQLLSIYFSYYIILLYFFKYGFYLPNTSLVIYKKTNYTKTFTNKAKLVLLFSISFYKYF